MGKKKKKNMPWATLGGWKGIKKREIGARNFNEIKYC